VQQRGVCTGGAPGTHIASVRLVRAWIDVTRLTVQATLVVRHVKSGRLFVNFDAGVVQVRPRVCAWLVVFLINACVRCS
jgi:hypothetical protein